MAWIEWTNLIAYGALAAGVLFLIWSLIRGSVSVLGLAFLIAGLVLELVVGSQASNSPHFLLAEFSAWHRLRLKTVKI